MISKESPLGIRAVRQTLATWFSSNGCDPLAQLGSSNGSKTSSPWRRSNRRQSLLRWTSALRLLGLGAFGAASLFGLARPYLLSGAVLLRAIGFYGILFSQSLMLIVGVTSE